MQLSNQPIKGTSDWFPEEFKVRKYIFDTWRQVCTRFGYEEYLTPLLENADIYRAKSGEDVGGKELMVITDRGERELAIRPEMTPSVTRMITRRYESLPKPIRYFSIANFWRNENTQRGRNREFWQLNADIFGSESLSADVEVIQLAIEIMLAFAPPQGAFVVNINNRQLIDAVLERVVSGGNVASRQEIVRVLDKWEKLPEDEIRRRLGELQITEEGGGILFNFMYSETVEELLSKLPWLADNPGLAETQRLVEILTQLGYAEYLRFQPNIIRGFDYYDGMVFEVFDRNPDNNRAMFGGGRYNGLAGLFGGKSFPAVGFAPGDETMRLFLESWGMIEKVNSQNLNVKSYLPILSENLEVGTLKLAQQLRRQGEDVVVGLEVQKLGKALDFANKIGVQSVIILGENEMQQGQYLIKDMQTGEQRSVNIPTL